MRHDPRSGGNWLDKTIFVRFLVSAGVIRLDQARAFGPQAGFDFFTQIGFDPAAASALSAEVMQYAYSLAGVGGSSGPGPTGTGAPPGVGTVGGPIPIGPPGRGGGSARGPGSSGSVVAAEGGTTGGTVTPGSNPFPTARLIIGVNGYPVVKRV